MTPPTIRPVAGGREVVPWSKLTLVEQLNRPDTALIEGGAKAFDAIPVGTRVRVTDHMGATLLSGLVSNLEETQAVTESGEKVWTKTAALVGDLYEVWSRDVWPVPTAAFSQQGASAHHRETGPAETAALAYLRKQGAGAPDRPAAMYVVPASQGRGASSTWTARFTPSLGELVANILEPAGLRVTCRDRQIEVTPLPDLTGSARYGDGTSGGAAAVSSWRVTQSLPEVTMALVGAAGVGESRLTFAYRDAAVEAKWGGYHAERFIDQRQTDDITEMQRAAYEAVIEGSTPMTASCEIPDVEGMRLGTDVPVGALIRLDLGSMRNVRERLRSVRTTWTDTGVTRVGTVGPESGDLTRDQIELARARTLLGRLRAT